MDIRIKEVQETNFGSWEIRIERSNGEDLVGFMTYKNISRLLTALDFKAPGVPMGLEDPKKLVGISSKNYDLELKIYNKFIKLYVSFPANGFFYNNEVQLPLGKISLAGVEVYDNIGKMIAFVLQPPKSSEIFCYYLGSDSIQKLENIFKLFPIRLLTHDTDAKFKVKEVNNGKEDETTRKLFVTLTISMPTPSALD